MLKDKVVCCFCGESMAFNETTLLSIQPNVQSDEAQQLFCHKNHLAEKLHASVVLHPDLVEE